MLTIPFRGKLVRCKNGVIESVGTYGRYGFVKADIENAIQIGQVYTLKHEVYNSDKDRYENVTERIKVVEKHPNWLVARCERGKKYSYTIGDFFLDTDIKQTLIDRALGVYHGDKD